MHRMEKQGQRQGHGLLALSALILGGILLLSVRPGLQADIAAGPLTDIGIQHDSPVTIRLRQSTGDPSMVDITGGSADGTLHVPASWVLREVRGSAVENLGREPAANGYTRYRMPAGATLSFRVGTTPRLRIHNGSAVSLLIIASRVDLQTHAVQEKSVIVTEKAVELW